VMFAGVAADVGQAFVGRQIFGIELDGAAVVLLGQFERVLSVFLRSILVDDDLRLHVGDLRDARRLGIDFVRLGFLGVAGCVLVGAVAGGRAGVGLSDDVGVVVDGGVAVAADEAADHQPADPD